MCPKKKDASDGSVPYYVHLQSRFFLLLRQRSDDFPEAAQSRLKVINNLRRQFIRFREIVQISQALVLQPEDVQAGFIPADDLVIAESAPAPLGIILLVPDICSFMAVQRVIAGDKFLQVVKA